MTLGELLETLANGELRFEGLVSEGETISADHRGRLIGYINQGLTRIYTRFTHETDFLTLELDETIHKYWIHPLHAVTDATVGNTRTRYIKDSVDEPFDGKFIRMISLTEQDPEQDGNKLGYQQDDLNILINERQRDIDRVKTLAYNKLYFRSPVQGRLLTLEYQKNHEKMLIDSDDETEITLFPTLEEALISFIAGKTFISIGGEENQVRGQAFFQEYERVCRLLEAEDMLQNSSTDVTTKLEDRGFS